MTKSMSFDKWQKYPRNGRHTPKQYTIAHITARKDQIHEFSRLPEMPLKLSVDPKIVCNSSYNYEEGPNLQLFINALETVDRGQNNMQ